jgi:peptidoglycan/LPS O-acetylase OafA/YrhL
MTMEFIFGAIIGLLVTSGVSWRSGTITVIAAIWLTAALCYQGVADEFTLKWGRVLLFGFPCAALIYGMATLDMQGRIAWLIPAFAGTLVTGGLFQFYPTSLIDPASLRAQAVILPVITGSSTALVVLWLGWIAQKRMPELMLQISLPVGRVYHASARLGDWSYSLYLTHLFSFGLLKWIFSWIGQQEGMAPYFRVGAPGLWDNFLFISCGVSASLIGAFVTYYLVERPALGAASAARRALFQQGPRQKP